ncbi:hypothetical protein CJF42_24875 [Pseudoalteromonas sp. NBT06-2]|uniref:hypothetical protein n=1 Tax=Pseudoalteromonas sp. NBT06-2 TaxID=2025950 RepID=UPI000BA6ECC6|nr:hypothetical protein [Pseudoalteromonas sp. NBT06-2]PAJ71775.1 hypothetical protein CJF42_24875 [Pseudoalteromonas sp. NBT06-2]
MKNFILVSVLALVGCATPQVYNPTNTPNQELSNVRTSGGEQLFLTEKYSAFILYIYDENKNEITKRNALSNQINDISLPAGEYRFQVSCQNKWYEGTPLAFFKLEPSKQYEIYCDITKGSNFLGMSVDSKVQLKIKEI